MDKPGKACTCASADVSVESLLHLYHCDVSVDLSKLGIDGHAWTVSLLPKEEFTEGKAPAKKVVSMKDKNEI